MKKLKQIIIAVVLVIVLHFAMLLALTDKKVFPCQISSIGGNMQVSEWRDGKCDVNYKHWIGSVQKMTPGSIAARIALIYALPLAFAAGIMYRLNIRKIRADNTLK